MSQFHESLPSTGGKAQSLTPDPTRRTSHPQVDRNVALVLGGGGAAGNAWEIGVVAGLADAGLDLTEAADLVIGTSSGASAAAQVRSGIPVAELFASVLSAPVPPVGQNRGGSRGRSRGGHRPCRRPRCTSACGPSAPPLPRPPISNVRWARSGWKATPSSDPGRNSGAHWSLPGCLATNGRIGR